MTLLTQHEADSLLAMEKYYRGSKKMFVFPDLKNKLIIPLHSHDKKEEFILDLTHGRISLEKNTFQTRARKAIVLARLDLGGSPHRNPDGEELECPHLHLYKEGFGDKYAYPLPKKLSGISDPFGLLYAFMDYCVIIEKPTINKGVFA